MPNPKLPNGYSRVLNHRVDALVDPTGKMIGHMTDTDDVYHALWNAAKTSLVDPVTGLDVTLGGGGSGLSTGRTITAADNALATDAGKIVVANSASAVALTILNDTGLAVAVDTVIAVYQVGAGVASFAAGSGVTIRVPSSYSASVQYDTIFARKVAANEWVVSK